MADVFRPKFGKWDLAQTGNKVLASLLGLSKREITELRAAEAVFGPLPSPMEVLARDQGQVDPRSP